jgi:hypothetical protein
VRLQQKMHLTSPPIGGFLLALVGTVQRRAFIGIHESPVDVALRLAAEVGGLGTLIVCRLVVLVRQAGLGTLPAALHGASGRGWRTRYLGLH